MKGIDNQILLKKNDEMCVYDDLYYYKLIENNCMMKSLSFHAIGMKIMYKFFYITYI